jgi:hypothetical protein
MEWCGGTHPFPSILNEHRANIAITLQVPLMFYNLPLPFKPNISPTPSPKISNTVLRGLFQSFVFDPEYIVTFTRVKGAYGLKDSSAQRFTIRSINCENKKER